MLLLSWKRSVTIIHRNQTEKQTADFNLQEADRSVKDGSNSTDSDLMILIRSDPIGRIDPIFTQSGLTGHLVEEAFSCSIVALQDLPVHSPVQVCDETGGFTAFAHLEPVRANMAAGR